jgi:uncharacterized membrane protein
MVKKRDNGNGHPVKHKHHPLFRHHLTIGQKASDRLSEYAGSWYFILGFGVFLLIWMALNVFAWISHWDPYPFILLNLVLSCIAAVQAPIILMTQNRQAERDRIDAQYDHAVNRKAERENRHMMKDLESIKRMIREINHK